MGNFWDIVSGIRDSMAGRDMEKRSLNEGMSREEVDALTNSDIDRMLSNPLLQLCAGDPTLEFWIERIKRWYKNIKITHVDPLFNDISVIPIEKMLEKLSDKESLQNLGLFVVEPVRAEKCILYREYKGGHNKKYREEFIIEAEFDKSRLKKKE